MGLSDERLHDGDLDGAREILIAAVRTDPADARSRLSLAEVLMAAGDLDRADVHLDAAQNLDTSFALAVALSRQLIRAARWRDETFTAGRPPDLVTPSTPAIDAGLAAILGSQSATGDENDAAEVAIAGCIDGRDFAGWCDADDRTAGVLEVMTATGTYFWVPLPSVRALRWEPIQRLRDTIWRPAELEIANGPHGVVYLPAIYHADASEQSPAHRLGRATDWLDGPPARGVGLRTWLIGDDAVTPGDFAELTLA